MPTATVSMKSCALINLDLLLHVIDHGEGRDRNGLVVVMVVVVVVVVVYGTRV